MNRTFSIFILVAALTVSVSIPADAFALDYTNFFAGADSQESNSVEKKDSKLL